MADAHEKPVVVGVDGSEAGFVAVGWAVREAARRGRRLRIVHAWSWPLAEVPGGTPSDTYRENLLTQAEQIVKEAAAEADDVDETVEVQTQVLTDLPVPSLLAESDSAELMVLGARGLGGFTGLLLGSVSLQVSTHARCPVVVVRQHAPEHLAGPVVVGDDGSELSAEAVRFAFEAAALRRTRLVALMAWTAPQVTGPGDMLPVVYDYDAIEEENRRLLSESLSGWRERFPDVDVDQRVVHGRAAHELIEQSRDAALLVVGSRGRGGFRSLLLGSVGHAVLHHASCPVAVVRPPAEG